ncbi:unknown [Clostridium sp. CAG:1024]|nr:unknown [Clostridium sp. CAG:1024]
MPNRRPSSSVTGMDSMEAWESSLRSSSQAWWIVTALDKMGGVSKSRSLTCVRTLRRYSGASNPNLSSTSCVWSEITPMRAAR